jgi:hypothetical protein
LEIFKFFKFFLLFNLFNLLILYFSLKYDRLITLLFYSTIQDVITPINIDYFIFENSNDWDLNRSTEFVVKDETHELWEKMYNKRQLARANYIDFSHKLHNYSEERNYDQKESDDIFDLWWCKLKW